jgi:hypothetical protein
MSKFVADLAKRIGVPYLAERDHERLLGHRLKEVPQEEAIKQGLFPTRRFRSPTGEILETDEFPTMDHEQLTDEVWTHENWPTDPNNTVLEALQKVPHGIIAIYYHMTCLNLVLVTPERELIGIRRTALYDRNEVQALNRLKKAATA